jgi:hypothetical protein
VHEVVDGEVRPNGLTMASAGGADERRCVPQALAAEAIRLTGGASSPRWALALGIAAVLTLTLWADRHVSRLSC